MVIKKDLIKNKYFFSILGVVLTIALILMPVFYIKYLSSKTATLHFSDLAKVTYKVCLKANDIFSDRCLGEGREYLTSHIDYIEFDFEFSRDFKKNANSVDISYNYFIEATTLIHSEQGKLFKDSTKRYVNTTEVNEIVTEVKTINESVRLIFAESLNQLTEFRNQSSSAKGNVLVVFNVKMQIKDQRHKETVNKDVILTVNIPLTSPSTSFEIDGKVDEGYTIKAPRINSKANLFLTLFFLTGFISIGLGGLFQYTYRQKEVLLTPYEKFIRDINKKHGKKITNAKKGSILKLGNKIKIIDIENFDELLEHANSLGKNIVITRRDYMLSNKQLLEVSWATVIDDNILYRKIYKANDKEFK